MEISLLSFPVTEFEGSELRQKPQILISDARSGLGSRRGGVFDSEYVGR